MCQHTCTHTTCTCDLVTGASTSNSTMVHRSPDHMGTHKGGAVYAMCEQYIDFEGTQFANHTPHNLEPYDADAVALERHGLVKATSAAELVQGLKRVNLDGRVPATHGCGKHVCMCGICIAFVVVACEGCLQLDASGSLDVRYERTAAPCHRPHTSIPLSSS
jgi:hypothetical protein